MNSHWKLPPDPFENDPDDPAFLFDDDEPMPPLTAEERASAVQELQLIREFRRALSPVGINGVFFVCDDCEEEHYYDWDIMESNMLSVLAEENTPVHEPSANPDPNRYVPWDYCLGYLDGMQRRRFF